ncbi:isoaspartyl peptidase/L-asparaginase [Chloracidobacterium aggregatum]|uniref:isoaspartyl peptidase/L-asparaginase n=1 Tax=Chloracidobacterium aggregatum TaxID=2851959 RepID=UPI0024B53F74|nr:isoaspartyl peptidase/L-asparaginase [Chloracidobacterium aggregatum]
MNHIWSRRAFLSTALATTAAAIVRGAPSQPIAFAIHGGAGVIEKGSMTPEREAQYRLKLTETVTAGHQVLKRGGTALDAVVTAIVLLEDSGIFNAGKGAVFTSAGTCELDASIMNGANRAAGPWPASNASKTHSCGAGRDGALPARADGRERCRSLCRRARTDTRFAKVLRDGRRSART